MKLVLLWGCLLASAGAQELSRMRLLDARVAAQAVASVPPVSSARRGPEVAASAAEANARIVRVLGRLDGSYPWPQSQVIWGEAGRIAGECSAAAASVSEAAQKISVLRDELADGAGPASVEASMRAALSDGEAALVSAVPEADAMRDYYFDLQDLKKADPRAKDLVAHIGMLAAIANAQRAGLELRKEADALAQELSAKGRPNTAPADYRATLSSRQAGPWRKVAAELDAVARSIGPDNAGAARAIQDCRVFEAPPSL